MGGERASDVSDNSGDDSSGKGNDGRDASRGLAAIGALFGAAALIAAAATGCAQSGTIGAVPKSPHPPTQSSPTAPPSPTPIPTPTPRSTPTGPATPTAPPIPIPPALSDADLVRALSVPVEKIDSDWVAHLLPGGDSTTTDTLDLCGASYASESKRTARYQMQYGPNADDLPVSNEVVTYRDGGATDALRELQDAIAHCPTTLVQEKDPHGGRAIYHVSKLLVTGAKWRPGTISILVRIDHEDGTSFTFTEVIQSRGNVLSIVYGPLDGQVASAETMKAANTVADLLSTAPLTA